MRRTAALTAALLVAGLLATPTLAYAAGPATVALGAAGTYSVLGGTGVTSTGATNVTGDLGVSPSSSVAGFPPGTVGGTVHAGDPAAAAAQTALVLAYTDASLRVPTGFFAGDQNGQTFTAGVYHTIAAFALTGTMTLDAQNDPNAVFIFQVGAALNTAAASHVNLVRGALASHVFWQALGAVGLGAASTFAGTIMSAGAITVGAGTALAGRALCYGIVTLANNPVYFTNTKPPAVTITGGPTALTMHTSPTISGTSDAPTGTAVTVTIAGQTLPTTVQAGAWTVTAATLALGTYTVLASVTDTLGVTGTAHQALTVAPPTAQVALGTAGSYSVLAGTGVVNTGATNLSGDLGVSPSSSIVGFPPGTVGGVTHAGDPQAAQAQADLVLAYNDAAGRTPTASFAGDQNGQTFTAGVYNTVAAFALTGTMTLDAQGDPNAVFIFQVGAALNTAAASNVNLINGAQASRVFWQVLGAAGTGASSSFSGTIMAAGAITVGANAVVIGRALSYGTVTLASNTFTTPAVSGGVLSISVPADAGSLGTLATTLNGEAVSGPLGQVQVSDLRNSPAGSGWIASVTSTAFTSPAGPAIAASAVSYSAGPITRVGTATYTANNPSDLTAVSAAVTASGITGNNSATWNPTISVAIPPSAVAGLYSATITHSVL